MCTAAWACRNRGLDVDDLALSPLSQTGHFQRKLDEALGINSWVDEHVYWADVPSHDHRTNTRTQLRHPMLLVHERVADEFAENAVAPPEAERDELLALPRFRSCPLLRELGWDRLALLGFYIDSAPWSKSDSFYAFYWNGIFSRRRHLITIIRKRDICRCGCGGPMLLKSNHGCHRLVVLLSS